MLFHDYVLVQFSWKLVIYNLFECYLCRIFLIETMLICHCLQFILMITYDMTNELNRRAESLIFYFKLYYIVSMITFLRHLFAYYILF